jgi:MFS family permease
VDHPCEKCGAVVEDGRPFCPQCRAPQIHVQMAASAGEGAAPTNDAADPPIRDPQANDLAHSPGRQSGLIDQRAAMRSALKAGAIGTFIGMIPVLGIVLTGSLSVYFYRRKTGSCLSAGAGARLGAAAGLVLFALNALFVIPIIAFHRQQESIDAVMNLLHNLGMSAAIPQFQSLIADQLTPSGLARSLIFALVFASIGGVLGALMMRRSP